MKKLNRAFTLAEVLITLGIIGVVAALTIPTLIQNTKNAQYVTSLKKFYTNFNQVLLQITNDYGCNGDLVCTGLFAAGTTDDSLGDVIIKHFKVVKNCGTTRNLGCFSSKILSNMDRSNPSSVQTVDTWGRYEFITADGASVLIFNRAAISKPDCSENDSSGKTGNLTKVCGDVWVDVNGLKGPNILGRDTFVFSISNGKGAILYPDGGADCIDTWWNKDNRNYCSSTNPDGVSCTGRVMEEGWQMNY